MAKTSTALAYDMDHLNDLSDANAHKASQDPIQRTIDQLLDEVFRDELDIDRFKNCYKPR